MSIILASGSPRRRELLQMIGMRDFKVIPDDSAESIPHGLSPARTVCEIALGKAINVSRSCHNDDIIIAADTLVYLDGNPIGKPRTPDEAAGMLRSLSGRGHEVHTGLALLGRGERRTCSEMTEVFFRPVSEEEILAYVRTGEPMDKAGAYAAQGRGAVFVERVCGEFFNVMGMPLCRLSLMLKEFGVETE